MKRSSVSQSVLSLTLGALALQQEISNGVMPLHKEVQVAGCHVAVRQGTDSLWLFVSRPDSGSFALRTAYAPGPPMRVKALCDTSMRSVFEVTGSVGMFLLRLETPNSEEPYLRCTVTLKPIADLLLPFWPRDLYVLDRRATPRRRKESSMPRTIDPQ